MWTGRIINTSAVWCWTVYCGAEPRVERERAIGVVVAKIKQPVAVLVRCEHYQCLEKKGSWYTWLACIHCEGAGTHTAGPSCALAPSDLEANAAAIVDPGGGSGGSINVSSQHGFLGILGYIVYMERLGVGGGIGTLAEAGASGERAAPRWK